MLVAAVMPAAWTIWSRAVRSAVLNDARLGPMSGWCRGIPIATMCREAGPPVFAIPYVRADAAGFRRGPASDRDPELARRPDARPPVAMTIKISYVYRN